MKALTGRRILITRARHQAESLAAALDAEGAEVLAVPAIQIIPPDSYAALDAALSDAARYQWLILTSVNGVAVLAERMELLTLKRDVLRHLKIVAIGPATARALEAHGLHVDLIPRQYVAESLVEALREQVAGRNVLLVRAKVARDVIPLELKKAGASVHVVDAYQTVVPAESCAALREIFSAPDNLPDAIAFTSSSTVTNFFRLLHQAGFSSLPTKVAAVSIGPVTSQTLREHGVGSAAQASEYTIPGLVAALCQWFAAQSSAK